MNASLTHPPVSAFARIFRYTALSLVFMVLACGLNAQGGLVPHTMEYQGRLILGQGDNGPVWLRFSLVSTDPVTLDTTITEIPVLDPVEFPVDLPPDGFFSAVLDFSNQALRDLLADGVQLRVEYSLDEVLDPAEVVYLQLGDDQPVTAVPFALRAGLADQALSAQTAAQADNAQTAAQAGNAIRATTADSANSVSDPDGAGSLSFSELNTLSNSFNTELQALAGQLQQLQEFIVVKPEILIDTAFQATAGESGGAIIESLFTTHVELVQGSYPDWLSISDSNNASGSEGTRLTWENVDKIGRFDFRMKAANAYTGDIITKSLQFVVTPKNMRYVPAGSFWMGNPYTDTGVQNQRPYHPVEFTKPIFMDTFEVSNRLWNEVVNSWKLNVLHGDPDFQKFDEMWQPRSSSGLFPVTSVNWYTIAAWCNLRTQLEDTLIKDIDPAYSLEPVYRADLKVPKIGQLFTDDGIFYILDETSESWYSFEDAIDSDGEPTDSPSSPSQIPIPPSYSSGPPHIPYTFSPNLFPGKDPVPAPSSPIPAPLYPDVVNEDFGPPSARFNEFGDENWSLLNGFYVGEPTEFVPEPFAILQNDVFPLGIPQNMDIRTDLYLANPPGATEWKALIIFDYVSLGNFKFIQIDALATDSGTGSISIGRRNPDPTDENDPPAWETLAQITTEGQNAGEPPLINIQTDKWYDLQISIDGNQIDVTLTDVLTVGSLSHTFSEPLNDGVAGLGTRNSTVQFNDFSVIQAPYNELYADTFGQDMVPFIENDAANWEVLNGSYVAFPADGGDVLISIVDDAQLPAPLPETISLDIALNVASVFSSGLTEKALIVFDYLTPENFKFVEIDAESQRISVGENTSLNPWDVKAFESIGVVSDLSFEVTISIEGNSVNVFKSGAQLFSEDVVFPGPLNLRPFGVGSRGAQVAFESFVANLGTREAVYKFETSEGVVWRGQDYMTRVWPDFSYDGYRLPTEAEWEYAARGGLFAKRFAWGDAEPSSALVNSLGFVGGFVNVDDSYYPDNGFGLRHITGNAREWVSDWYDADYYASSPLQDPIGPMTGNTKGFRGGAFNTPFDEILLSYRNSLSPSSFLSNLGFRTVRPVPQNPVPSPPTTP